MISDQLLIVSLSVIAVLMTICGLYLLTFYKKQQSLYDLEDDEYDFLGSPDGIPSNLDLARAYIAMNQLDEAKSILKQITQCNDLQYQQQAQLLLTEIEV